VRVVATWAGALGLASDAASYSSLADAVAADYANAYSDGKVVNAS